MGEGDVQLYGMGILIEYQDRATKGLLNTITAFDRTKVSAERLSKGVALDLGKLEKLTGAGFALTGAGIAVGAAGAGMLGFFNKGLEKAREFEWVMTEVRNVTGASAKTFKDLRSAAIEAGIYTQATPTEAAQALRELSAAGLDADQAIKGLRATLNLNLLSGGRISAEQSASTMAALFNKFKIDPSQANRIVDMIVKTSDISNMQIEDMPAFINSLASAPGLLERPIQELFAMGAMLRNVGQEGAQSGHTIAGVVRQLGRIPMVFDQMAKGKKGRKVDAMKELGLSETDFYDLDGRIKSMPELFGNLVKATANMTQKQKMKVLTALFPDQYKNMLMAVEGAQKKWLVFNEKTKQWEESNTAGSKSMMQMVESITNSYNRAESNQKRLLETSRGIEIMWKGTKETLMILLAEGILPVVNGFIWIITQVTNFALKIFNACPIVAKLTGFLGALLGVTLVVIGGLALLAAGALFVIQTFTRLSVELIAMGGEMAGVSAESLTLAGSLRILGGSAKTSIGGMTKGFSFMGVLSKGLGKLPGLFKGVGVAALWMGKMLLFALPYVALAALVIGALYAAWKYNFFGIKTAVTESAGKIKEELRKLDETARLSAVNFKKAWRGMKEDTGMDAMKKDIVALKVLWISLKDAWGDYTLSADNWRKLNEVGLRPVLEMLLRMKYRADMLLEGMSTGIQDVANITMKITKIVGDVFKSTWNSAVPVLKMFGIQVDKIQKVDSKAWKQFGQIIGWIIGVDGVLLIGVLGAIALAAVAAAAPFIAIGFAIKKLGDLINWLIGLWQKMTQFMSAHQPPKWVQQILRGVVGAMPGGAPLLAFDLIKPQTPTKVNPPTNKRRGAGGYSSGGEITKSGYLDGPVHQGEVITRGPLVRKLELLADSITSGGTNSGTQVILQKGAIQITAGKLSREEAAQQADYIIQEIERRKGREYLRTYRPVYQGGA